MGEGPKHICRASSSDSGASTPRTAQPEAFDSPFAIPTQSAQTEFDTYNDLDIIAEASYNLPPQAPLRSLPTSLVM